MSSRSALHRGGQKLRTTRANVLEVHGAVCGRCSEPIDLELSGLHPRGLTLGHIVPASRPGGSDDPGNLRPEHRSCNLAAGARCTPPRATIAKPIPTIGTIRRSAI